MERVRRRGDLPRLNTEIYSLLKTKSNAELNRAGSSLQRESAFVPLEGLEFRERLSALSAWNASPLKAPARRSFLCIPTTSRFMRKDTIKGHAERYAKQVTAMRFNLSYSSDGHCHRYIRTFLNTVR